MELIRIFVISIFSIGSLVYYHNLKSIRLSVIFLTCKYKYLGDSEYGEGTEYNAHKGL